MKGALKCISAEFWNKVADRLWPFTFGAAVLITVFVLALVALSFLLVYGAAFSILSDSETWRGFQE
jgi:hypothetical protein